MVQTLPANAGDVGSIAQEDSLEEEVVVKQNLSMADSMGPGTVFQARGSVSMKTGS